MPGGRNDSPSLRGRSSLLRLLPALALVVAAVPAAASSCTRRSAGTQVASGAPESSAAPDEAAPEDLASVDASVPEVTTGPWLESVRGQRWAEATERLEALSDAEKARPEMKFLRAKVYAARADHAKALPLLEGLEKELPLLSRWITRQRTESQIIVGPFDQAAAALSRKSTPRGLIQAANAYEKAGQSDESLRTLERAISASKGGADEAEARSLRAANAKTPQATVIADLRWICLHHPAGPHGKKAYDRLVEIDPTGAAASFTDDERIKRAEALSDAGKSAEAIAEMDRVKAKPGKRLHHLGRVHYKLRQWKKATEVLDEAIREGTPEPAEDEFYAARALSRANNDDEAIRRYEALIKHHAKSAWAEEASFLIGRLHMLQGHWTEAARAYESFRKNHTKGKWAEPATFDLALSRLQLKQPKKARELFAALGPMADSKLELAHYRELEGVAAMQAGDRDEAIKIFQTVMRDQPLSWPALVSRSRLTQLEAPIPPLITVTDTPAPLGLDVKLPAQANLLHQLGLDGDAEEALRSAEPAFASLKPRDKEALCQAYEQIDRAQRRFRLAQDAIKADDYLQRAPGPSNQWAWSCFFPRPYSEVVHTAAKRDELPAPLIWSIMRQESAFQPEVVSPARAVGLLQLLPETAKNVAQRGGVTFEDGTLTQPAVNIDLGSRYASMLVKMWKGNIPLAVASYNAGPGAVSRWLEQAESLEIDLWVARIPFAETRTYVQRVVGNLARYAYMEGGESAVPMIDLAIQQGMRAESGAF